MQIIVAARAGRGTGTAPRNRASSICISIRLDLLVLSPRNACLSFWLSIYLNFVSFVVFLFLENSKSPHQLYPSQGTRMHTNCVFYQTLSTNTPLLIPKLSDHLLLGCTAVNMPLRGVRSKGSRTAFKGHTGTHPAPDVHCKGSSLAGPPKEHARVLEHQEPAAYIATAGLRLPSSAP